MEALACSGRGVVAAGQTVVGEGLGMEALACRGLAAAGLEEGLSTGDPGSEGTASEVDSVAAGSAVSGAGTEGGDAKTVEWSTPVE